VNQVHGGMAVRAWEIDEFTDEEIEAFRAVLLDLPKMKKAVLETERLFQAWRMRHPSYGKFGLMVTPGTGVKH
jgi:hypothetical protein